MAKMNKKRIHDMSLEERQKQLADYKQQLNYQRALLAAGNTSDSPGKIKIIRKTIARLLTAINMDAKKQQADE